MSCLLLCAVLLLFGYRRTDAVTWNVRADWTGDVITVQAGIDSARDGDTVLVHAGTYFENIDLRGKAVHLKSVSGPQSTILNGSSQEAPVVSCVSGERNTTIIEGFTITEGRGFAPYPNARWGGGILCLQSYPQILGNVIKENRVETPSFGATWGGGLLAVAPANAPKMIITDNVITQNFATVNGGGAYIQAPSILERNIVSGNSTGEGDGGGIYATARQIEIRNNHFVDNTAGDHGGALVLINATGEVYKNIFLKNKSTATVAPDCSGGTITSYGYANIHHNTIAFNRGESRFPPPAGGICLVNPALGSVVAYNIISQNQGSGIVAWAYPQFPGGTVSVRRNVIYGNDGPEIHSSSEVILLLESENLFLDPLFCLNGVDVAAISPAMIQAFGSIGATDSPGCGPTELVEVIKTTWGSLKRRYITQVGVARSAVKLGKGELRER